MPPHLSRWLRPLGWLAIGLALAMMAAWLLLPGLLQREGERWLSERLGRRVQIGQVNVRPWSLELTVRDLQVEGASREKPLLSVGRLYANAEFSSFWRMAPILSAFEIDAPALNLTRLADGRYDIDDVIERVRRGALAPADTASAASASAPVAAASSASAASTVAVASAASAASAASGAGTSTADQPPRFALHNLQLRDGSVHFDDRPVGRVHEVKHVVLTLPFLSNLPSDVEVKVEPRLAFALDDAVFDSGAQSTPFAQHRSTALKLRIGGDAAAPDNGELDLSAYAGYLPSSVPVRLMRGFLAAELDLSFSIGENGTPNVALSGTTRARDVTLQDPTGAPLLQWRRLVADWKEVRPVSRRLVFGQVRIDGAEVDVNRAADGQLNLQRLATAGGDGKASAGWQLNIDQVLVDDSLVRWRDATTTPAAAFAVDELSFGMRDLRWPMTQAVPVDMHGVVRALSAEGADAKPGARANPRRTTTPSSVLARLDLDGTATPQQFDLGWRIADLQLAALQPYLARVLDGHAQPRLDGRGRLSGRVTWQGATDKTPLTLRATVDDGEFDALRLVAGADRRSAGELAGIASLRVSSVEADVQRRHVQVGRLQVKAPNTTLTRTADGRWSVQDWIAPAPRANGRLKLDAPDDAPAAQPDTPPWTVGLAALGVEGGRVRVIDRMPVKRAKGASSLSTTDGTPALPLGDTPVGQVASAEALQARARRESAAAIFDFQRLSLKASELAYDGESLSGQLALQASMLAGGGVASPAPARLDWQGKLVTAPLQADGQLVAESLPLPAFERYATLDIPVDLLQGTGHYRGRVTVREARAGTSVASTGQLRIDDLRLATRAQRAGDNVDDLLRWQQLALDGLKLQLEPRRKPRIEIAQADLKQFFSRLLVTPQGRFELLELTRPEAPAGTPTPVPADARDAGAGSGDASAAATREDAAAEVARSFPVTVPDGNDLGRRSARQVRRGFAPAAAAEPRRERRELPIELAVQSTRFSDGRIAFTDRFVQPNFSADLSDLRGTLGAYRSGSPEMAPIELQGVVARTGRLQVNGRLNPTADPLALDVRAQATQVEMPPLSPYAGRYAGYEIDRGKLNLDIHYDVQPDGRLEAQHHLVLDQLAFGRRVESPQATKLPVRLATALLQDKNGVIDLNLPVTGSLQNPDFSVGGVIAKMLGNLLAKAVTSPFSLIAGAQGDMERVEFQPGTDVPTAKGRQTLDRLAKALADRPSLRVTLTGEAATGLESGALHEAMFEQRLHTGPNQKAAERRARSPWGSGPSATESAASAPPLAERERLLRQLYRDTDLPDKPRNFFGIAKDIPVPEMEARLRAQVQPGPDDWRELAADRAMAVRDALVARGLPVERLFTAAPKVHQAEGPSDDDGRAWVPSTSLSLSAH